VVDHSGDHPITKVNNGFRQQILDIAASVFLAAFQTFGFRPIDYEHKYDGRNIRNGYTCHREWPFKIWFYNFILRAFPLFVNISSISQ
jgi:hypothetical protein